MERFKAVNVFIGGQKVGTLATYKNYRTAFEYSDNWLQAGFSISPLSLPLQKKVFLPKYEPFDGLFGVFSDSLPDGWGRLLVDRLLAKEHIDPQSVDMVNCLAIVGETGVGALIYRPVHTLQSEQAQHDYDRIAEECRKVLESDASQDLDTLFALGGSSGGTHPKIFVKIDGEDWIIKFPASIDRNDIGEIEYRYSLCAKQCGIEMPETRLFPSKHCPGYFGIKRFDRGIGPDGATKRIHMVSVAGLLETSHHIPSLDYIALLTLTLHLTKNYEEVEKMFRLMCFNVYAHNRDDHAKNFSFLYDVENRRWQVSPAYDLTYSNSLGGEHATMVNGNGKSPGKDDLLAVADHIGLASGRAKEIEELVRTVVAEVLGDVNRFA